MRDGHERADLVADLTQPLGRANARVVLVNPEDDDVPEVSGDFHARVEVDSRVDHLLRVAVPVVALPDPVVFGQIDPGEAHSLGLFKKFVWLQRRIGGSANGVNVSVHDRAGRRLRIHGVSRSKRE